jgi:hypothetical protein
MTWSMTSARARGTSWFSSLGESGVGVAFRSVGLRGRVSVRRCVAQMRVESACGGKARDGRSVRRERLTSGCEVIRSHCIEDGCMLSRSAISHPRSSRFNIIRRAFRSRIVHTTARRHEERRYQYRPTRSVDLGLECESFSADTSPSALLSSRNHPGPRTRLQSSRRWSTPPPRTASVVDSSVRVGSRVSI